MSDYISGFGPSMAHLAVVGEQPTEGDMRHGMPFSDSSGQMVKNFLSQAGVNPDNVYFTYCIKRPTFLTKEQRAHEMKDHAEQLQREIEMLNPGCVLGLGNIPLFLFTGERGIEKWRGSPLKGGGTNFVGTLHPYSLRMKDADGKMRDWSDSVMIKWDMAKASRIGYNRTFEIPRRHLEVCNSSSQLYQFLRQYKDNRFVSIDIETWRTFPICIGLAFNRNHAISVPLTYVNNPHNEFQMSHSELANCWQLIAELLWNPAIAKIGQNGKFDERLLDKCNGDRFDFGLPIRNYYFDTNLAFKTLFPELRSNLGFMTSVLTDEPYYKDEGKEYNPKKDRLSRLLLYNAKDAAVTFECFETLVQEMSKTWCYEKYSVLDFFMEQVMPRWAFYTQMERHGIKRDNHAHKVLELEYDDKIREAQEEFDNLGLQFWPDKAVRKYKNKKTGKTIYKRFNTGSTGPKGEMRQLVYGYMSCPSRKGVDEKTIEALIRNGAVKDPNKVKVLQKSLDIRKLEKMKGTYIGAAVDPRGRLQTQVKITLETGRTGTSILKSPIWPCPAGAAFQTVPKHGEQGRIRNMYIPDEGFIFFESDLSQAEARVVAVLAKDMKLKKMFDYGLDVHRVTAAWIIGGCPDLTAFFSEEVPEEIRRITALLNSALKDAVNDEDRQMGKKFRHAGHYDMQKREAAIQTGFAEWRAGQILEGFHKTNPNIKGIFHQGIIQHLEQNQRVLVSPHGRRRQFFGEWGRDTWKEAYADIPQATVSDHLKDSMMNISERMGDIFMVAESHDSFLALVPLASGTQYPFRHLDRMKVVTKEEMEKPIDFTNCSLGGNERLIIPCDMGYGDRSWYEMHKIKG